ncbi:MAG: carboxypeptidase-like regulatory domain-containing protein, partial [Chitinophagaceae bacterium]|nr:carboxypeptidase-like regulatory domain-containing protein [Chitinophagaceae bacterium]
MKKPSLLTSCLLSALLFSLPGQAQKQVLQGTVRDKQTAAPLRTASIRNIFSGNTVVSRSAGQFSIPVSKGNILSFSATGYYTDTLTVTDSVLQLSELLIALRPLAPTLPDVTVTAGMNAYQLDSLERRRQFLALVGESRIPTVGKANELGFGMAINLDHFSKREKKKRT